MIFCFQTTRLPNSCWLLLCGGLLIAGSGCQMLSPMANRQSVEREIASDPDYSIENVQGPAERRLNAVRWERQREELQQNPSEEMSQALAELDAAQALYDAGEYRQAEQAFGHLASERRKTYESFRARWERWWGLADADSYDPYTNFGDPVEEDALFMKGESQFAQMRYARAQDTYDDLLNRYPSSRHLDHTTRQLFRIARYWLDFPEDVGASGDTELAADAESGDALYESEGFDAKSVAIIPNLTDRSRPTFDTYGRGLQALRSIWLHDATGPLADDALMLSANHNLRKENFVEAARLYSLLREQYPDSPHFKDAFVLGSHVTLASYEGAEYDPTALQEARSLKETTLKLFPDLSQEQRGRLMEEVERLGDAEIERQWQTVQFYKAKGIPESVALHCYLIINRYPDSKYASMARDELVIQEAKLQAQGTKTGFWQMVRGGLKRDSSQEAEVEVELSPNELTAPAVASPQGDSDSASTPQPRRKSVFGNLLRRAEQPPELQPVPSTESPGASGSSGKASL